MGGILKSDRIDANKIADTRAINNRETGKDI